MARHNFTYRCGHEGCATGGNAKQMARKAEYMSQFDCYECKRDAANAEAATKSEQMALPALTGSERQIAWAITIRVNTLEILDRLFAERIAEMDSYGFKHSDTAKSELRDACALIRSEYAANTDARFWIDSRDDGYSTMSLMDLFEKRGLTPTLTAELNAIRAANKAAREAKAAQLEAERNARREVDEAERAERERAAAEAIAKARTFRVSDRAGSVSVDSQGTYTIKAIDGRTATAYMIDGELAVCSVGGHDIDSLSAEAERIAREALAVMAVMA